MDRSFEFFGLPGSVRRFADLCELKRRAVQAAEKAGRARELGSPEGAVDEIRSEAVRYRDMAVRGLRSLRTTLAARTESAEWAGFVDGLPASLPAGQEQPDLGAQMNDLLGEARRQLVEAPIPAGDAAETFDVVRRVAGTGRDGLNAVMGLLIEALAGLEEVLQRDSFGREPASPSTAEYIACTLAATAFLVAAGIGCSYIPWCWCCIFPLLLLAFYVWIQGCESIPRD